VNFVISVPHAGKEDIQDAAHVICEIMLGIIVSKIVFEDLIL
jgi:hypothetical protein